MWEFSPWVPAAWYPAAPPVWRIWNHQTPISTIRRSTRVPAKELTGWWQTYSVGAGIHTVGPGMESLSPPGGVLQGDPGVRQLTEANLSASINELPQDWLSDLTHTASVGANPTLKALFCMFYTCLKTCCRGLVWPSRKQHRGEWGCSVVESWWSGGPHHSEHVSRCSSRALTPVTPNHLIC